MKQIKMKHDTKKINNKGVFREILKHKNKRKMLKNTGQIDLLNLNEYRALISD